MSKPAGVARGSASADNATVLEVDGVLWCDIFELMSTQGAMDVYVSLDGTNFTTAPLSLTDQGATDAVPVIETVANRMYGFRGKFRSVRVLQKGATAVTDASMSYGTMSG